MELTYNDLRKLDVVNAVDGKRLGKVCDIVFDSDTGMICGFVVPFDNSFRLFKSEKDIMVPYSNISKIGDDVILVNLPNKSQNVVS